jgi:preprotein translocase subunit SecG
MSLVYYFAVTCFLLVCAILCGVILLQESKTSGMGSSFGGEASSSVFGTSTADVLKKFTAYVAAIFFTLCVVLSFWTATLGRTQTRQAPTVEQQQK